ncbi:hypothetical protein ACFXDH_10820 [Streptomyces sp. NPDC059467]|uniref:hypothetical protein n=1 Tax=Streptomyces sp. NPDC059467 TaxID=3346844 RepID=UPI0036B8BAB3
MERAQEIGDTILERLSELADAHDALGDIRVQGAVIAIQVAEPGGLTLRHRLAVPQRQFN